MALGVIASLLIAAVRVATLCRKSRASVDTASVGSVAPSSPTAPTPPTTDHHVLPAWQKGIRATAAGLIAAAALSLLITVLASAHGSFDSFQVSSVTLAAATLAFSPGMLRRFEHDHIFFLSLAAGFLPLLAAYLVIQQEDSLNAAIATVTVVTAVLAIATAALETTNFGRWVWMWKESPWEWTLWPTLCKKRGSSPDATVSKARTP